MGEGKEEISAAVNGSLILPCSKSTSSLLGQRKLLHCPRNN
jgi:hypothetical protein